MAARNDQVEAVQVERFDGGGEERQIVPIPLRGPGQVLDERRVQRPGGDATGHGTRHVQERENLRIGAEDAQRVQHLLASPHSGQPVMDERDSPPRCGQPRGRRRGYRRGCREGWADHRPATSTLS
jgi:hypothetical protein